MSYPALTRRERVVRQLAARIRAGQLPSGTRLAGEKQLAHEFNVSRGTIRGALADLADQQLITTRAGLGSFITYDGAPLDSGLGWARALDDSGTRVTTEVLSIAPVVRGNVDQLPADVSLAQGFAVRRLRRAPDGAVVSYEIATVPAKGTLADLPTTGLVNDSLATTLAQAGLVTSHGRQLVDVIMLDDDLASVCEREPGTAFLRATRTAFDAADSLVEHVVSYLDPEHFRLELTFGGGL